MALCLLLLSLLLLSLSHVSVLSFAVTLSSPPSFSSIPIELVIVLLLSAVVFLFGLTLELVTVTVGWAVLVCRWAAVAVRFGDAVLFRASPLRISWARSDWAAKNVRCFSILSMSSWCCSTRVIHVSQIVFGKGSFGVIWKSQREMPSFVRPISMRTK